MQRDQHGLETTAACEEAVRLYDRTILHFLGLRADTGDRLREVFQADPEMPMAHCARGYFMKLFCTPPMERKAAESLAEAERFSARGATARERLHVTALAAWCAGDIVGATERWEAILLEHPCDVLALRLGHFTHFYLGDSEGMRDSVARVLPWWDPAAPGYGFVLGYHAFGLEETGRYDEAEAAGRCAVEINPADIWSTHAVAHVMEMQGRHRDGAAWLSRLTRHWDVCNNFRYHAWWHLCLFLLEQERFDEVLALYDTQVRADKSADYLDMSNAIALLWRLEDLGVDVGDRWKELADKAEEKIHDHIFAFHDAHYVTALSVGGRRKKAQEMLTSMEQAAHRDDTTEGPVFRDLGLPLCRAIDAMSRGDHARAVDLFLPVRRRLRLIGGSHAQRDLFFRMLVAAALKCGRYRVARALLAERTALDPHSTWAWKRSAEALDALGQRAPPDRADSNTVSIITNEGTDTCVDWEGQFCGFSPVSVCSPSRASWGP